jgi:hypothetical protein
LNLEEEEAMYNVGVEEHNGSEGRVNLLVE